MSENNPVTDDPGTTLPAALTSERTGGGAGENEPLAPRPGVLTPGLFVLCVLLGFAGIAGLTLSMGNLKGVRPPDSARVFRWSGEGSAKSTEQFQVEPGWEIRWEHSGKWGEILEEIAWITPAGVRQSIVSFPNKPLRDHGSVNVNDPGEYRLEVHGRGRWTIEVFQLR